MDLEKFVGCIPDFDNLSSGNMISYFVYYIEEVKKKKATIKEIKKCYTLLGIKPYSNISMYMKNNRRDFISTSEGIRLERSKKESIRYEIRNVDMISEYKILISHSSKDSLYGEALVNLLRGIGLKKDQIIYTSSDLYGVPIGNNIFEFLRENIDKGVLVLFLLSENYFKSVACQNEMGAAWLAKSNYIIVGVPKFDFASDKFVECCLDNLQYGIKVDNRLRITEFKEKLKEYFALSIDDIEWQQVLEDYMCQINAIEKI